MDALGALLNRLKKNEAVRGNFPGFLHVLIGRKIYLDGTLVCGGISWRELATWLKKLRWDPDAVRELGLDPKDLPPRDRYRFWYLAIAAAQVDSPSAIAAGERFAQALVKMGYEVSPFRQATG